MAADTEALVDVVVVGAGPSGSSAAMAALKGGASVAVIDKATFPRAKLCGGLITGRCAQHLRDVFGTQIETDLFETRSRFAFFMDGECLADVKDAPAAHLTMRWDFDEHLYQKVIAAGAQDFTGCRIEKLELSANRITLSGGQSIRFSCLVGADGVRSQVAEALFGQSFDPSKIGFALEIESVGQKPGPDTPIRVDFAAASWGYGWSFPKRRSTTIGVGGLQTENPDMKHRLSEYLNLLDVSSDAKIKGHFLPFGGFRNRPGRDNVLLVGDAAGFVDPITGEGIGYAIQSGALAGRAAAKAVAAKAPETAFSEYLTATRPIRTAILCARLLRPIIFARGSKRFFASAFRSSRSLKRDYMNLLDGRTEYPQILTHTAIRLPRAMLLYLWRKLSKNEAQPHDRQVG